MCDRDDFFRRMRAGDGPAWRWKRACNLHAAGARPDTFDDPSTIDAWAFLTDHAAGAAASTKCRRRCPSPVLPQAAATYAENGPLRWEIEARLLAGITPEEVAGHVGLATAAVASYADTFFDVRGRLEAHDWIWLYAVRVGHWGPAELTEADVWRYVAASGGPAVLDVLVADFLSSPGAADPDRRELAEDIRTSVRFVTTPMTDKKAFGRIMRRMWRILASRVTVHDDSEWEKLVQHMDFLELAAGLRTPASGRESPEVAQGEADQDCHRSQVRDVLGVGEAGSEVNAVDADSDPAGVQTFPVIGSTGVLSTPAPTTADPVAQRLACFAIPGVLPWFSGEENVERARLTPLRGQ